MTVHIGPYIFDHVRYDHDADVLYLAQGDPARAVDSTRHPEDTPSASTRTAILSASRW